MTTTLEWHRIERGRYEARGESGTRYYIGQNGSQDWTLYEDGEADTARHYSLSEAQLAARMDEREATR